MPTCDELNELEDNCTWTWTTQNGVKGYKVTSKVNSNYIFLPAAGERFGSSLSNAGSYGYYWSSTPRDDSGRDDYDACSLDDLSDACSLGFLSDYHELYYDNRDVDKSVRPVIE